MPPEVESRRPDLPQPRAHLHDVTSPPGASSMEGTSRRSHNDGELKGPVRHAADHEERDDQLIHGVLVVGILEDVVDRDAAHEIVHEATEQVRSWTISSNFAPSDAQRSRRLPGTATGGSTGSRS